MNRYLVLEAIADRDELGDVVRMQVLNIHASATGAYWHWQTDERRLHLIDLKTRIVYSWLDAGRLMCVEQLRRLDNGQTIGVNIGAFLQTANLITPNHQLTAAGRELLAEFKPAPALVVPLSYIQSKTKMKMK